MSCHVENSHLYKKVLHLDVKLIQSLLNTKVTQQSNVWSLCEINCSCIFPPTESWSTVAPMSHFTFSTFESLLLAPRGFSHIKLEIHFIGPWYNLSFAGVEVIWQGWTSKMVILTSQGKELFLLAIKYFFPKTATKTRLFVCNKILTFRRSNLLSRRGVPSSVFRGKCLVTEAPIYIWSRWACVADGNFPVKGPRLELPWQR